MVKTQTEEIRRSSYERERDFRGQASRLRLKSVPHLFDTNDAAMRTVSEFIREEVPERSPNTKDAVVDALRTLTARGLFHYDVHWGNVRWRDGAPVMVDFDWASLRRAGFPYFGKQHLPLPVATEERGSISSLCAVVEPAVGHTVLDETSSPVATVYALLTPSGSIVEHRRLSSGWFRRVLSTHARLPAARAIAAITEGSVKLVYAVAAGGDRDGEVLEAGANAATEPPYDFPSTCRAGGGAGGAASSAAVAAAWNCPPSGPIRFADASSGGGAGAGAGVASAASSAAATALCAAARVYRTSGISAIGLCRLLPSATAPASEALRVQRTLVFVDAAGHLRICWLPVGATFWQTEQLTAAADPEAARPCLEPGARFAAGACRGSITVFFCNAATRRLCEVTWRGPGSAKIMRMPQLGAAFAGPIVPSTITGVFDGSDKAAYAVDAGSHHLFEAALRAAADGAASGGAPAWHGLDLSSYVDGDLPPGCLPDTLGPVNPAAVHACILPSSVKGERGCKAVIAAPSREPRWLDRLMYGGGLLEGHGRVAKGRDHHDHHDHHDDHGHHDGFRIEATPKQWRLQALTRDWLHSPPLAEGRSSGAGPDAMPSAVITSVTAPGGTHHVFLVAEGADGSDTIIEL